VLICQRTLAWTKIGSGTVATITSYLHNGGEANSVLGYRPISWVVVFVAETISVRSRARLVHVRALLRDEAVDCFAKNLVRVRAFARSAAMAEDFVAGTLGGMAGVLVGHPADTVKVRCQRSHLQPREYADCRAPVFFAPCAWRSCRFGSSRTCSTQKGSRSTVARGAASVPSSGTSRCVHE